MRNLTLILILFSFQLNAQIPDYSELTKRDKIYFLNYYGYIKMKSGDTIFGAVKRIKSKGWSLDDNPKLIIKYAKQFEKYKYLKEIPISQVDMYYDTFHKKYNYIKKLNRNYLILNKVVDGKIQIYEKLTTNYNSNFNNNISTGYYEAYFEDEKGNLTIIFGSEDSLSAKKTKSPRERFIDFFKDSYDLEVLQKVKPTRKKIIEFVEKHNKKNL